MSAIVVYHTDYGCDTGCCGHRIEKDGVGWFDFYHPYGEDPYEWAKEWVKEAFGADHVKDLDWENCLVLDE